MSEGLPALLRDFSMFSSVANYGIKGTELGDALVSAADEIERLRSTLDEIDGELDLQLHDDGYIKSCRENGLDVPKDCQHHIIIKEELRQKIAAALANN